MNDKKEQTQSHVWIHKLGLVFECEFAYLRLSNFITSRVVANIH